MRWHVSRRKSLNYHRQHDPMTFERIAEIILAIAIAFALWVLALGFVDVVRWARWLGPL
jgi:hypothetical protein